MNDFVKGLKEYVAATATPKTTRSRSRYLAWCSREYHCYNCDNRTIGQRTLCWVQQHGNDSTSYLPLSESEARDLPPSAVPTKSSEKLTTRLAFCPECRDTTFRDKLAELMRRHPTDGALRRAVQGLCSKFEPVDFPTLETLAGEIIPPPTTPFWNNTNRYDRRR